MVGVAKTAVKKAIPSFYAAITHQDTGSFNQHQNWRWPPPDGSDTNSFAVRGIFYLDFT